MYTIGQVSGKVGLSNDTLRYYERLGLLAPVSRNQGGQRRYSDSDVSRLNFIRRAQSMNFTLAEVDELMSLRSKTRDVKSEVRELTAKKLVEIDRRIEELSALRSELSGLITECQNSKEHCPIIAEMDSGVNVGEN